MSRKQSDQKKPKTPKKTPKKTEKAPTTPEEVISEDDSINWVFIALASCLILAGLYFYKEDLGKLTSSWKDEDSEALAGWE